MSATVLWGAEELLKQCRLGTLAAELRKARGPAAGGGDGRTLLVVHGLHPQHSKDHNDLLKESFGLVKKHTVIHDGQPDRTLLEQGRRYAEEALSQSSRVLRAAKGRGVFARGRAA